MDIKKSLKDVVVLLVICSVFAVVLAAVNSVTAPIIADRLNAAADEAYMAVMPGATGFEDVDLTQYAEMLPGTVKEAKREKNGKGFAIKLETKGYATGMVLIIGVDANGVVTGATCIASNETWGLEATLGDKFVGKDIGTVVDVEAGATSYTVNGYRNAVKDAINTATILGGGSADTRTEDEILADNLNSALPAAEGKFTKIFIVEILEGINKVYSADNNSGYVFVIGEGKDAKYVGVAADGSAAGVIVDATTNEVTEGTDELNATAQAAAAILSATTYTDVDLTLFEGIHAKVQSVQVTGTGNYIIVIKADGHGIKGDPDHEHASGKPYIIKVCISATGEILDSQTVEHTETPTWGGNQLVDGAYNSNFIGKTQEEAKKVDTVADSTNTTSGYKQAVLRAFEAYVIITGGAN